MFTVNDNLLLLLLFAFVICICILYNTDCICVVPPFFFTVIVFFVCFL